MHIPLDCADSDKLGRIAQWQIK